MSVASLFADIDYVKLMDEKTPPKDILAPYLTATNINNIMKLAAKIPDKVSYSVPCSVTPCLEFHSVRKGVGEGLRGRRGGQFSSVRIVISRRSEKLFCTSGYL